MDRFLKNIQVVFFALLSNAISAQTHALEGMTILEKSFETAISLKSYEAEVDDSSEHLGVVRYKIREQDSDSTDIGFGKCIFWASGVITSADKKQNTFGISYDGSTALMLDYQDNALLIFEKPTPLVFASYKFNLNYPWDFGIFLFGEDMKYAKKWMSGIQSIEIQKDTKIYNEECYTLFITNKFIRPDKTEHIFNVTYFIGKSDYVIRGVDTEKSSKRIKILRKDEIYDYSVFTISTPVGFAVKQASNYIPPNKRELLALGSDAPEFTLHTSNGKEVSLSDYRGKVVLLDFWGTWCGPCRMVMPHLQALHEKYKSRGLEVIGISVADAEGKPEKFMKDNNYTYGLMIKGEPVARSYQVVSFPTVYLIDASGKIVSAETGTRESFEKDITTKIENLLEK